MTWKPYIFIVGAWSQWDREVVVVEAEKMKNSEEMAAYVKYPFLKAFFFLFQVVVPSIQSRLRNFWNAEVCMACRFQGLTVPTTIFTIPHAGGSNLPWHPRASTYVLG